MTALTPLPPRTVQVIDEAAAYRRLIDRVVAGCRSPHTERAYRRQLGKFIDWFVDWKRQQPGRRFSREMMQAWQKDMLRKDISDSAMIQARAAIHKMVEEAMEDGLIDGADAASIMRVKYSSGAGHKVGNWLTHEQMRQLVATPDAGTLHGIRDRAILAVMCGAGLRRSEVVSLDVKHLQRRAGRWVLADVVGKRSKVRTVPVDESIALYIQRWLSAAGLSAGAVFRSIHSETLQIGGRLTPQAVYLIVKQHAGAAGFGEIKPHDLRRSYAETLDAQKAPVQRIQGRLGHSKVETTIGYLSGDLHLSDERTVVKL